LPAAVGAGGIAILPDRTTAVSLYDNSGVSRVPESSSPEPGEPLSPELVLVSPQLRLKALNALPERPWEAVLPPSREEPSPVGAAVEIRETRSAPVRGAHPARRRRRRLLPSTLLVAVALVAAVALAKVLPGSFEPRPGRPAGRSAPVAAEAPSSTSAAPVPTRTHPAVKSAAATPVKSAAATQAHRANARTGRAETLLAVPRGGYVFGSSGRFQVSADLQRIRLFQTRLSCARRVVVATIPLHSGTRFSYGSRLRRGKRLVTLEIAGRFLDRRRVRGYVRAHSAKCDSGKSRFLARLS
jgi:hypothetical protein